MTETSNIVDGTEPLNADRISMLRFGCELAKTDLLTDGDKKALALMFEEFILQTQGGSKNPTPFEVENKNE